MKGKGPKIQNQIVYEGSLIGVLWHLLVSIAVKHVGGLVVFVIFLLLTERPWTLGLIAFLIFVVFVWVTELVFHSHYGD